VLRITLSGLAAILAVIFLNGCASSPASRTAASNMDMGVKNAKNFTNGVGNGSITQSYQNSSQTTKGALLGGAAGAVAGSFTSGIGFLAGTAGGAILGASYGAYIDSTTTLADKLENRGVTVVELGDQILIVVPSSRLFTYMSDQLQPEGYSTIDLLAQYINSHTNVMVKVAGYTNDTGSKRVDLALSQQQAKTVAKTLEAYHVNTRVLFADGYGGNHLVERNSLDWDNSENYRIEITLEKLA
jgi:outer membrane protein OmpA-like peptidoglycan-associated protein